MKKIITLAVLLLSTSVFAENKIEITIISNSDLTGVASARFLAKKDSFFCKRFSMNDGSPTRISKDRYDNFKAKNGIIDVPAKIKSKCNYERVGGASLSFEIKGKAEPYNVVSVFQGTEEDAGIQTVKCKEIISGPSGKKEKMIACYGDLTTDSEGRVIVEVIKE
ncbi:MAG: hypothetical protein EP326_03070 [Deltaproteobacteria bacterium]|nr:MAG: hypothetical protein EP326_03070 [Deltaproteobacteria bacterium]TNF27405.1 MAG: hypothetical protein EP319_11680 [Deltaproteobacteria bacterium]